MIHMDSQHFLQGHGGSLTVACLCCWGIERGCKSFRKSDGIFPQSSSHGNKDSPKYGSASFIVPVPVYFLARQVLSRLKEVR